MRKRQKPTQPPASREKVRHPPRNSLYDAAICLALLIATFAVYWQVRRFDFVNIDDPDYVTENPYVRQGITPAGLKWALTSGEAANWFPLTRISHLLDVEMFALDSGRHHLTNVLLHALATLALFAFLKRATGARWPSAWVAFVFALDPLHVESVAWVAERKDVLSALFWFVTLYAYVRYAERPGIGRYLVVLLAFCLGLMSKPMVVTLPVVLLLVDRWPLQRKSWLIVEKAPLFALAIASAVITFVVQQHGGAVEALSVAPIGLRVENALVSYVVYILKILWPSGLAVFYPYPRAIPLWQAAVAAAVLSAVTFAVRRSTRTHPYLEAGWLWYLVTLLPVIGLVQVGAQARADRYMYIPMTGLSIMAAWGAAEAVQHWPRTKPAVAALAGAWCVVMVVLTWQQIPYWQDSQTLFRRALDVTSDNGVAHNNLGLALAAMPGRLPEAIAEYEEALRIEPSHAEARNNLGAALLQTAGRETDAIAQFEAALRIRPDYPEAHNNLGNALAAMPDRLPQAIGQYEAALRIRPDYADAHNGLGSALLGAGRSGEAIAQFEAALRIDPGSAEAHYNLGIALARGPGRMADAIAQFETALRLQPDMKQARIWLDRLRASQRP